MLYIHVAVIWEQLLINSKSCVYLDDFFFLVFILGVYFTYNIHRGGLTFFFWDMQ